MARLGDTCRINMGQSPDSATYNEQGVGLPFYQGNADFGEVYPSARVYCSNPVKIAQNGDILISVRAPIGALNIAREKCCIGRGLAAITINEETCCMQYLWYALLSKVDELNAKGTGSTFKAINRNILEETEIPLPSIDEQRAIATKLDTVYNLISLRKKQLQKLDDLVKARFVEMFGDPETNPKGWKKESLKEHAEVIVGYPFPSEGYTETGISIVGGYNLMQGFIQWEDSKHWPNEQGYKQYLLQSNDIVMAMDRPWVNGGFKIAKVEAKYLPALLIQRTACIRGRDLEQEFLYSLLNTQRFAEHCNVTGSLVPHISNKDINSFKVIIPPEKVQKQFSAFASQADESKQTIQQGLDKLEQMNQALMQKYFGC